STQATYYYNPWIKQSPRPESHPCDEIQGARDTWYAGAQRVDVAIVGGGLAGLSAAKTLGDGGFSDFVLLEAQGHLGGRVYTVREGSITVEEGAEWIHGGWRNPLYRIAREIGAVDPLLPDDAFEWRIVTQDGAPVNESYGDILDELRDICERSDFGLLPYYDLPYGMCYLNRFSQDYDLGNVPGIRRGLLHFLEQTANGEEGTEDWLDIGSREKDKYPDFGLNHQWKNGFDAIVEYYNASIQPSNIKLSSPVCRVLWDEEDDQVLVVTQKGDSYLASHAIVTFSLGHLKERHTKIFEPPLPESFTKYLGYVDLGIADKVQLGWTTPWWGDKPLTLDIIWTSKDVPQDRLWLYNIVNIESPHSASNVLQVFLVGRDSVTMENLPEETVLEHMMYFLKRLTRQEVPEPIFFHRTTWYNNPWTRGAYESYITLWGEQQGMESHDTLAIPVVNSNGVEVIGWAGEHTHSTRFGTADGAMDTGEREAHRILDSLEV
ncbi:spermine oxidase-like, partial [Penaeus japonicus]|uniref:spermine oxidase-like n=1 Tax=Penaeus japonicus TaxID=27405 RepID=UPI001C71711D